MGADVARLAGEVDRVRGVVGAGPGDHRRLVADLVEDSVEEAHLLVVGQGRRLASGAGDHEAVAAVVDQAAGQAAGRVEVDRAVRRRTGVTIAVKTPRISLIGPGVTRLKPRTPAGAGRPTAAPARAEPRRGSAGPRARAGPRAGPRRAARPSVQCSGREIAGWPVALKIAVNAPAGRAPERVQRVVAVVVVGAQRRRGLGHRRREQQVEAALVPGRDAAGDELMQAAVGQILAALDRSRPDLGERPGQRLDVVGGDRRGR